jgi:AraC-like DNA-binding protein
MSGAKERYTTSRGNVLALSQAIESYGVDPEPILCEGGVELAQFDANSRLSSESMDRMICMAVEVTGDQAFGLRFVDFLQPTSYHALGVALLYSPTLRSFCQRLERYFAMVTTLDDSRFVQAGGAAYLVTRPLVQYSETLHRCHSDGWAAWVVKLLRQMCRPDFSPLGVALIWTPPAALLPTYEALFQCPLELSAAEARIYLDPAALDQPLPTSNAELARHNDQVVAEFLAGMDKADLPSLVRIKMIEFLPSGDCDRDRIAQVLNMTVRTLHNKLEGTGTSYQQLLDETRQELAQEYIEKNRMSVSDIAYLLGYTDVSSFSRAFKRWSGLSPRAYFKSVN